MYPSVGKHKRVKKMKTRNFVAKYSREINRSQTFRNRKTDYSRKAKHTNKQEG